MVVSAQRHDPAEDWSDEVFVEHWIDRQAGRAAQRNRQFGMLRAMIPFTRDAAFRYLNVGAGPGFFDALVLERYPAAHAVLLDGSPAMLAHAARRLDPFATRATFVQSDFAQVGWAAAVEPPVDLIVSCIAIHNLRQPAPIRRVYAEIYQLLAEGGLFLNFDYVRMPSRQLPPLAAWAASDPESGFMTGGGGDGMPGTTDEQVGWLREAGFAHADCFFKEFRLALFGGFKNTPRIPDATHRADASHRHPGQ
jgi:tRNA (cmo5U34)-methyltransferase